MKPSQISIKPFLRLAHPADKVGTIYIRMIADRKPKSQSLKIKVRVRDWHPEQWVTGGSERKEINSQIRQAIEQMSRPVQTVSMGKKEFGCVN